MQTGEIHVIYKATWKYTACGADNSWTELLYRPQALIHEIFILARTLAVALPQECSTTTKAPFHTDHKFSIYKESHLQTCRHEASYSDWKRNWFCVPIATFWPKRSKDWTPANAVCSSVFTSVLATEWLLSRASWSRRTSANAERRRCCWATYWSERVSWNIHIYKNIYSSKSSRLVLYQASRPRPSILPTAYKIWPVTPCLPARFEGGYERWTARTRWASGAIFGQSIKWTWRTAWSTCAKVR